MKLLQKLVYSTAITFLVLSLLFEEVDARRKILRGRRTITRTYYRGTAIPAWAIVVIVGGCQLIVGGVLYLLMNKLVLGSSSRGVGSYDTGDV